MYKTTFPVQCTIFASRINHLVTMKRRLCHSKRQTTNRISWQAICIPLSNLKRICQHVNEAEIICHRNINFFTSINPSSYKLKQRIVNNYQQVEAKTKHCKRLLKGLFHPAFLACVVSWLAFACHNFDGRHAQGMLDEADSLTMNKRKPQK